MPLLERAMQTPSKFWMRVRSPSTTLTPTRSVSPGRNSGIVLAFVERGDRLGLELLDEVHCLTSFVLRRCAPEGGASERPRGARSGPAALAVYRRSRLAFRHAAIFA